jgi:hypothetical protein
LAEHYCRRDAAGPHETTQGELSSRMAALTTGGDLNPTCLGLLGPLVSGGLVAGRRSRRARTWLLRTATRLGPAQCQEPFPISPSKRGIRFLLPLYVLSYASRDDFTNEAS